jgi:2-dehydropantoate 2-reductase
MVESGSDVTFLVRKQRAEQLRHGLTIESPRGNAVLAVQTVTENERPEPFDAIVLSCKSYGLPGALEAISPFVRPGTPLLPLLNGYGHLEQIESKFPAAVVWGGTAGIVATMTDDGTIRHMNPNQVVTAGTRKGQEESAERLKLLISEMSNAGIDATVSPNIDIAMWEKWTFLATLAAATCLMRGSVGEILATTHGEALISGLFDECSQTAAAQGHPPGPSPAQDYRGMLFDPTSTFTASMLRDMEAGSPTEASHIIGDMIARAARHGVSTPFLEIALCHLQVYETQRKS